MQIEEAIKDPHNKWAPFALGFRPFFMLAGVAAIALVGAWLIELNQVLILKTYYPTPYWHAHEMMFGYGVAVVSGFLLTAVRNWTDLDVPSGWSLAGLVLLWGVARVTPFLGDILPPWLIALSDLALLPVLGLVVFMRVWKRRQYSNMVFVGVLLTMFFANLMVHLEALGIRSDSAWYGLSMMMYLLMFIIVVMGGRVIPFFIARGVNTEPRSWKFIESAAGPSIVLLFASLSIMDEQLSVWFALVVFIIHLARVVGWYDHRVWKQPLVWVLILAYGWIVVSLGLAMLAFLGVIPLSLAWHAFTVGGLGGVTLGMMARVSLGHTGREMKLPGYMAVAFVFINLAAISRAIVPAIWPQYTAWSLNIAGIFWIAAFAIFLYYYVPMLLKARVDGRPG